MGKENLRILVTSNGEFSVHPLGHKDGYVTKTLAFVFDL